MQRDLKTKVAEIRELVAERLDYLDARSGWHGAKTLRVDLDFMAEILELATWALKHKSCTNG